MGWLTMPASAMYPHHAPKAYLDAQHTWESPATENNPFVGYRVLKSSCPGNRTYYAAVESYTETGERIEVTAAVCLVRWNTRASDGHIFGYKALTETAGPCEAACPASILALLTSTDNPNALDWRRRCHATLRRRSRKLPDGALVRFPNEIEFTDGTKHREFRVQKLGRRTIFTPNGGVGRYRIRNVLDLDFEIVREPKVARTFFPAS
jgi:hypothetical protein